MADCAWLVAFSLLLITVQSLPTGLENSKKTESQTKPKVKRSQEILMFGNQQNHQATDNNAAKNFSPAAEKRTLSNSGLDDSLSELSQQPEDQPKALPSTYLTDQLSAVPQHERNYQYGKVLVAENEDEQQQPQQQAQQQQPRARAWNLPLSRFYGDDRRKRSQDSSSTSSPASSSSSSASSSTLAPVSTPASRVGSAQIEMAYGLVKPSYNAGLRSQSPMAAYRSYLPYYQEPRYKRESEIDPEAFLALIALYDESRNRDDWRNYGIEEYEPMDDEANMIGNDDEDPRVLYPQQNRYYSNDPLLSSDLIGRGRSSYYDQYLAQQQQQQQQYDGSRLQYGNPQYGLGQQSSYYPLEKRFMTRKRSQNYDTYNNGRNGYMLNTRGYPNYQQRILY